MPIPQPAVGGTEADVLSLSDTIQRCELLHPPQPPRAEQTHNSNPPDVPPFIDAPPFVGEGGGGSFTCAFCMEEVGSEIIEGIFRGEPLIIVSTID